jgi:hypothetical protein
LEANESKCSPEEAIERFKMALERVGVDEIPWKSSEISLLFF